MRKTPQDIQRGLVERFRKRRLARNLTQEGLAKRSGMSFASLKRFEQRGLIAMDSLLRMALVLDCLDDFDAVGAADSLETRSLDEMLAAPKERRKGRIK
jgi:transcriptional regulator with XRE-family HTH domain